MTEDLNSKKAPLFNIEDIMRVLPHRYPFLLIDRVEEFEPNKSIKAIKNVTMNEPFFQGHFPGHPVMPGVLMIEAMAQAAGISVSASLPEGESIQDYNFYFMTVNEAKFRKVVTPGDRLEFYVTKERQLKNVYKFKGEVKVDGNIVAEARFSAIVFKKEN
ncbi:MAG: 3-hydroxyacyl-ACP dehydratase FabZ [Alphaproteobacteria bacterium]|nr:3-hydroxyacyl-ACP dehydratase FabZ [Alphaproteobacteria bacterium]